MLAKQGLFLHAGQELVKDNFNSQTARVKEGCFPKFAES